MRVVRARLPPKVRPVALGLPVFALKTLLAGPGLDQRAIDGEVLVGHQAGGPFDHAPEAAPGDLLIEQPVAILGERRRVPDPIVHRQADEPAKQQVVIELLHQQPLAADRVEDLQQLRAQQALRRNRRSSRRGIQPVELARHVGQDLIDEGANRPERMILRNPLLRRHITEHRVGLAVVSSHATHRRTASSICRSPSMCFSGSS